MNIELVVWVLTTVICVLGAVLGFLLRFLFTKASGYADIIEKLTTRVEVLADRIAQRHADNERLQEDVTVIRARLHDVENRVGRVEARCEIMHRGI